MVFSSVSIKIELYTSKHVNPVIQLKPRPKSLDGSIEKVFLGLVSLNSSVSCGFVWVCLISVSQFLVIESIKASVSLLGRIMFTIIYLFNLY